MPRYTDPLDYFTDRDLGWLVWQIGSVSGAAAYCRKIANVKGPLSAQYHDAADRLERSLE